MDKRGRPRLRGTLHILRAAMNTLGEKTTPFSERAGVCHSTVRRVERGQAVRFPALVEIEQALHGVVCALVLEAEAHGYEPPPGPWLDWWKLRPDTLELAKAHAATHGTAPVKLRYVGDPPPSDVQVCAAEVSHG